MNDYVNIETKTCFFGYGGIQVSTLFQSLILKGIKPPMGAGTRIIDHDGNKIGDWEYTGSRVTILFNNLDEVKEICNMIDYIEDNQGGAFEFKGLTFDFTKYEHASVGILRRGMDMIKKAILLVSAC